MAGLPQPTQTRDDLPAHTCLFPVQPTGLLQQGPDGDVAADGFLLRPGLGADSRVQGEVALSQPQSHKRTGQGLGEAPAHQARGIRDSQVACIALRYDLTLQWDSGVPSAVAGGCGSSLGSKHKDWLHASDLVRLALTLRSVPPSSSGWLARSVSTLRTGGSSCCSPCSTQAVQGGITAGHMVWQAGWAHVRLALGELWQP